MENHEQIAKLEERNTRLKVINSIPQLVLTVFMPQKVLRMATSKLVDKTALPSNVEGIFVM